MTINASVLPILWYSSLDIKEGDTVTLYSAIQNDSSINFSGTAKFYVQEKVVGAENFVSVSGQITTVQASWKSEVGNNSIEMRIETNLPEGMDLKTDTSGKSVVHVNKIVTKEAIKADTQEAVQKITEKGDSISQKIVDKLETFKQNSLILDPEVGPISNNSKQRQSQEAFENQSLAKKITSQSLDAVYNGGINALQFVATHWAWSLLALAMFYGLYKLWRKNL